MFFFIIVEPNFFISFPVLIFVGRVQQYKHHRVQQNVFEHAKQNNHITIIIRTMDRK
jgi:hypothetical protein